MIWILLKILVVLVGIGLVIGFTVFADVHRTRKQRPVSAVGRATVVQAPDVARHRAGAVQKTPYRNPLPAWVRQSMAPTANEQVALPAGPTEETCYLAPPNRPEVSQ